jgi:hypothetical protein
MNLEEKQDAAYKKAILAYLNTRVKTDNCLLAACRKENRTLEGVVSYIKQEAKKQATNGVACIPDDEVYDWAVHYILEDSLDCEFSEKKEKPSAPGKRKVLSGKNEPDKTGVQKKKTIYTQLSLF